MRLSLKNIHGKKREKNVSKYTINWSGKSRSIMQYEFKQKLKKYWIGHTVFEEFPVYGSQQKVDFVNLTMNIAIEINGDQHDKFVEHFHKDKSGFIKSLRLDRIKREWLEANQFELIELMKEDLKPFSPEYIEEKYGYKISL